MRKARLLGFVMAMLVATAGSSLGSDLDFGQAVIQVPDTHISEPYLWRVKKNPSAYRAEITGLPDQGVHLLTVGPAPARAEERIDLYLTDKALGSFSHPVLHRRADGGYLFNAALRAGGKYLAEIVFKDEAGWVNLSTEFKATASGPAKDDNEAGLAGYEVHIKQFPEKVYARHSVTLVFEVRKDGQILDDLEPADGALVRVAAWRRGSWFRAPGDFIYADSRGNETNQEAAVSLVPDEPGLHRVFAEFRHRDATRWVSKEIEVWLEPEPGSRLVIGQ